MDLASYRAEKKELQEKISYLEDLLAHEAKQVALIKDEMQAVVNLCFLFRGLSAVSCVFGLQALLDDQSQKIHAAIRVAPFVVVPGEHLHEIAVHDLRVGCIEAG